MTFYDWWKESVHGVKDWASAIFTYNPVLVVLVNDEYKRNEFISIRIAHPFFALYALGTCYLLWQNEVRVQSESNVSLRFEVVHF